MVDRRVRDEQRVVAQVLGEQVALVVGALQREHLRGTGLAGGEVRCAAEHLVRGAGRVLDHVLHPALHDVDVGLLERDRFAFLRHGQAAPARDRIFDFLHEVRLHHDAVVRKRRGRVRELQDREGVVALADPEADRLAVEPLLLRGLLERLLLPVGRRQDPARLALDVDPGDLAEAERLHEIRDRVHAEVAREHVEVGVVRHHDRLVHVDPALARAHVVAERVAAEREVAGILEAPARRALAERQAGERHERLVRRSGRVGAVQRAVQERLVGRVVQLVPGLLVDAVDERVRVEARRRHEREHVARLRLDRDQRAALAGERLLGHLLQPDVERQHEVVAGRRLRARQRAHRPAAGRHLDFLEAREAMQLGLVALLDTDLADVVGALVVVRVAARIVVFLIAVVVVAHRVDAILVALRDPADVADHVRGRRAERILPEQPRAHVDAGEAEALRGEARDFGVGEAGADRQALEVLRVFLQLLEAAAVARVDRDDLGQLVDRVVERVVELRRRDLERIGGIVLREDHAVAVGDDPAVRHDRRNGDAVFLGLQRVFAVLHQLQVEEAAREQPEADEHEHARRRDAQAELRELLLSVVEFGHAVRSDLARTAPCGRGRGAAPERGARRAWRRRVFKAGPWLRWGAYRPDRPGGVAASAAGGSRSATARLRRSRRPGSASPGTRRPLRGGSRTGRAARRPAAA
ncbi:hypothetical protein BCO19218_06837 [Burkholderia contaminans]|nr:hypothetical protein BCO19218_06837 [Burkholderia contaminans]